MWKMMLCLLSVFFLFYKSVLADNITTDTVNYFELKKLAFGSCFDQSETRGEYNKSVDGGPLVQEIVFENISKHNPDAWLWTGDAGYAVNTTIQAIAEMFEGVKSVKSYEHFAKSVKFIDGTWDDHDFGINDGGGEGEYSAERQDYYLDFLNLSPNNPRRTRKGVYSSHLFVHPQNKYTEDSLNRGNVKVILLDTRTFKDLHYIPTLGHLRTGWNVLDKVTILYGAASKFFKYFTGLGASYTGDLLGEKQWSWFEDQLLTPDADLYIVVSSTQVTTGFPGPESWGHYPASQRRLQELLLKFVHSSGYQRNQSIQKQKVMFLSGDVHYAQILGDKDGILEITSSGLTHSAERWRFSDRFFTNVMKFVYNLDVKVRFRKNFGILDINYDEGGGVKSVDVSLYDLENNEILLSVTQDFEGSGQDSQIKSILDWPTVVPRIPFAVQCGLFFLILFTFILCLYIVMKFIIPKIQKYIRKYIHRIVKRKTKQSVKSKTNEKINYKLY